MLSLDVDRIKIWLEKRGKKQGRDAAEESDDEAERTAADRSRKRSDKKPGTVKKVLALVVRLSRFAQMKRLTAPLSFLVELPKVHDEKTEFLTPEENAHLSAVLDAWPDPYQTGAVRLSRLTVLRHRMCSTFDGRT